MKFLVPDRQPHHKATGYSGGFYPARIEVEAYEGHGEAGIKIVARGRYGASNIILPLSFASDLLNLKKCIASVEHERLLRQLEQELKEETSNWGKDCDQQGVNALWQKYLEARSALNNSELSKWAEESFQRYYEANQRLDAQKKAEKARVKVNHKAISKAEFKAIGGKRSLRELVADESIVGTFEGWQFATKTGVRIELFELGILANFSWKALRESVGRIGWGFEGGYRNGEPIRGFSAIRASDQSEQFFNVDNVLAWKQQENA